MHELSICYSIIKTLQDVVKENDITEVESIVLEILIWGESRGRAFDSPNWLKYKPLTSQLNST